MNTRILKSDSRNIPFHVFGQTLDFVPESHFGDNVPMIVETGGGIDCTALSTIKIAYSQTKKNFDEAKLWSEVPHDVNGAMPQTTLGTAIKQGLLNIATQLWEKIWEGYFQSDNGPLANAFDNTRSAMTLAQSSAMVNTYWYSEWNGLNPLEVMPQGLTPVSEHSYVFLDWVIVNGVTMAKIDAHVGYLLLMPQEVFNEALSKTGCSSLMPSTHTVELIRKRTLLELLADAYNNLIIFIKRLSFLK